MTIRMKLPFDLELEYHDMIEQGAEKRKISKTEWLRQAIAKKSEGEKADDAATRVSD